MFSKMLLVLTFGLSLAGCAQFTGPLVDQSPEKQLVADTVHAEIMKRHSFFPKETGVKVMAACFGWAEDGNVKVTGLNWYYYPTRASLAGRPIPKLREASMGRCQKAQLRSNGACDCQIVDENNRNAIAVPDGMEGLQISVEFEKFRPRKREPEKVLTPAEKLEKKAGCYDVLVC